MATTGVTLVLYDRAALLPDHRPRVEAQIASARQEADGQRRAWMAAAQAGDKRAYERVLSDSVMLIRSVARRQGVPADLLDDVVQETLLTVHRVRHTYDPSRSYDAWLAAIARRRAIDALRNHGRRGHREIHDERALGELAEQDDASAASERTQAALHLRAAIAMLPAAQREAVEQMGLKERSLAAASAATGRNTGALKVNLHRALKLLRDRLHGGA